MKTLFRVLASMLALFSVSTQAVLLDGSVLSIDTGSYFSIEGVQIAPLLGHDGLIIGSSQSATGAHAGLPDGSESPGIDMPWSFNNATGMHWTSSPVNILSAGANTASLDFSGWSIIWSDDLGISMGSDYQNPLTSGIAQIVCGSDCSLGDSYSLSYSAFVTYPATVFSSVRYDLYLQGTISEVPLPIPVWLLGSGLIILASCGRWRRSP